MPLRSRFIYMHGKIYNRVYKLKWKRMSGRREKENDEDVRLGLYFDYIEVYENSIRMSAILEMVNKKIID